MAISIGRLAVFLTADSAALVKEINRAKWHLQSFARDAGKIGRDLMTAGAAILAPIGLAIREFMATGEELTKMAQRTGMSVEALSLYRSALEVSETSMEDFEKAVKGMNNVMLDAERGLAMAKKSFADLGLSVAQLQAMSPEGRFLAIADALSKVEDPGKRSALAVDIFSRSGTAMLSFVNLGTAGIQKLLDAAKKAGHQLGTEDVRAADALGDAMTELWRSTKTLAFEIGASLAKALTDFVRQARDSIAEVINWTKANRELVAQYVTLAAKIGVFLLVGGAALSMLAHLSTVLANLVPAIKAVIVAFAFLAAHPVVAGIATVGVAIAGVTLLIINQKKAVEDLARARKATMQNLREQVSDVEKLTESERALLRWQIGAEAFRSRLRAERMRQKLTSTETGLGAGSVVSWALQGAWNKEASAIATELQRFGELKKMLRTLEGAVPYKAPVEGGESDRLKMTVEEAKKLEQEWNDKLARQRIEGIENEFDRRAQINAQEWDEQRRQLETMGAPAVVTKLVDQVFKEGLNQIAMDAMAILEEWQQERQGPSAEAIAGARPPAALEAGTAAAYSAEVAPYYRAMEDVQTKQLRQQESIEKNTRAAADYLRDLGMSGDLVLLSVN